MTNLTERRARISERLNRSRFLIPNAVTMANLFCGFLCIIYASNGRFQQAAFAIGIAILLDGLDGRVARRLNATSKFGLELDSFSDLVSFGLAPAILMHQWAFQPVADEFGVIACFLYVVCTAARLARFNIQDTGLKNFQGLPTPGSAGMVAAMVHAAPYMEVSSLSVVLGAIMMPVLSYLMVSKIEFFSVKRIKVGEFNRGIVAFLGFFIALVWYRSQIGFLCLALVYVASGPVSAYRARSRVNSTDVGDEVPQGLVKSDEEIQKSLH